MVPCHGFHTNLSGFLCHLKIKTFPHPSDKVKKINPNNQDHLGRAICFMKGSEFCIHGTIFIFSMTEAGRTAFVCAINMCEVTLCCSWATDIS